MKKKYNSIKAYILDNSVRECTKETINCLFRAILTPIITDQQFESLVLIKVNDTENKKSYIQRLSFSNILMHSYNNSLEEYGKINECIDDIWETSEFIIVLGQRYSAALLWDFSLSDISNKTPYYLIYNSKKISEIAKGVLENSQIDFKEALNKYAPDRRENMILNKSVNSIATFLDEKVQDVLFSEAEKNSISIDSEAEKISEIVAEKAKFIAHEIKNNLSIIGLYSKITEKRLSAIDIDVSVKEAINTAISNIEKASQAISYHISDLRCLSTPYIREFDIGEAILETMILCEPKAEKAGIKIDIKNIKRKTIKADKSKVECAIMNIIFNAIEAGTKNGEITINCTEDEEYINIFISNNGEKIPQNIQSKIFEADFTTKEKGNGIGLTICQKQLEAINGSIKLVKSDETETVFVIKLKH